MCVCGGGRTRRASRLKTYAALVAMHKAGEVDFEHVVGFVLDEYCGVEFVDEHSQHHYIYTNLVQHVNMKRENLHVLNGTVPREKWADECATYESKITDAGGLDLVFCSTGATGTSPGTSPGRPSSRARGRRRSRTTPSRSSRTAGP